MRRLLGVAGLVLFAAAVGGCNSSGGSGSNTLIGSWKPAAGTGAGCSAALTFAATTGTFTNPGGTPDSSPVTYNVSPTEVTVITNAGFSNHVEYIVVDKDHVYTESGDGRCNYERVK